MDLSADIQKSGSVLIIDHYKPIGHIRMQLSRRWQNKPVIWLGLVHSYHTSMQLLEEEGIRHDKMFFIDCVTIPEMGRRPVRTDQVLYVDDPSDLTSMAMAIDAFLREIPYERYIVVHSLPVLHYYNSQQAVLNFIQFLLIRARVKGTHVVVLASREQDTSFIRSCRKLFDQVVEGHHE